MVKNSQPTDEQIEKLNYLHREADKAAESENLLTKLGALTIYSNLMDFYCIQAARLFEQIVLKCQLYEEGKLSFQPHEDSYFYDKRVNTRKIIKEIKKSLPFKQVGETKAEDAQKFNEITKSFLDAVEKFLVYRNIIIHHTGSPKKDVQDTKEVCDKAINQFKEALAKLNEFMKIATPFRFGNKELEYFYKK